MRITGDNGTSAEVNAEEQLVVRAINEPEIEHASGEGHAYSWDSLELDIAAGETMLFVKNTGSTPLILDRLILNGSNVICTWTVLLGQATTTPAGTLLTAVNLNTVFSNDLPDALAYSDETAVADGSIINRVKTAVSGHVELDMAGVLIGKNHYIQINQVTESTTGSAILVGHFEEVS